MMSLGIVGKTTTGEIRMFWGGVSLIFGLGIFANVSSERISIGNIVLAVGGIVGLMLINHRSAYVALAVAVFFGFLISRAKARYFFITLIAAFVMGGFVLISSGRLATDFVRRAALITSSKDPDTVDRLIRWGYAYQAFKERWLVGSMLSGEMFLRPILQRHGKNVLLTTYAAHNFVMETAATEGIVGLLFILFFYYPLFRIGIRNSKVDRISFAITMYLVFYFVFCLFNTNFTHPLNVLFLMLASAILLEQNRILHTNP